MINNPGYSTDNQGVLIFSNDTTTATNPYARLPASALLKPTDQITLAMWLWAPNWVGPSTAGSDDRTAFSCTQGGGYSMYVKGGNFLAMVRSNGAYRTASQDSSVLSGWHHAVYTYDNRYVKLYIDGQLAGDFDTGANHTMEYHATNRVLIGAEAHTGEFPEAVPRSWIGRIGMVQIYSRALTATEVSGNYNAHKLRYGH